LGWGVRPTAHTANVQRAFGNVNFSFRLSINLYRIILMTVERRDEPLDERQRRTAQLHGFAEFRASLELDMVQVEPSGQ
jgi:hypothetical protein